MAARSRPGTAPAWPWQRLPATTPFHPFIRNPINFYAYAIYHPAAAEKPERTRLEVAFCRLCMRLVGGPGHQPGPGPVSRADSRSGKLETHPGSAGGKVLLPGEPVPRAFLSPLQGRQRQRVHGAWEIKVQHGERQRMCVGVLRPTPAGQAQQGSCERPSPDLVVPFPDLDPAALQVSVTARIIPQ